jgi:hypothetical protein
MAFQDAGGCEVRSRRTHASASADQAVRGFLVGPLLGLLGRECLCAMVGMLRVLDWSEEGERGRVLYSLSGGVKSTVLLPLSIEAMIIRSS